MRSIQIKRGTAANTPTLADGELGLQTDAGKLVIGNGGANLGVAMDNDLNTAKGELNAAIAGKAPANHTHTADQVGARPNHWVPSKADVGLGNVDNTADSQKSVNYANSTGTANNANAVGGRAAGTVLSEIDNLKTSVANGKAQIASAISDKGVSTGAGADFGTMANNIRTIATMQTCEILGYGSHRNTVSWEVTCPSVDCKVLVLGSSNGNVFSLFDWNSGAQTATEMRRAGDESVGVRFLGNVLEVLRWQGGGGSHVDFAYLFYR